MVNFYKDKVIIITGASSGIGLASATRFASLGAKIVLAARSLDKLEKIAEQLSNSQQSTANGQQPIVKVNNLYKIWKRKDTDLNVAKQINPVGRKKAPNWKPRIRGLFAF